jgi:hypothetical protein
MAFVNILVLTILIFVILQKDLIVQTLRAEKKGNSFKDGRLIEKKRLMKEE